MPSRRAKASFNPIPHAVRTALGQLTEYSNTQLLDACKAIAFPIRRASRRTRAALLQALADANLATRNAIQDALVQVGAKRGRLRSEDEISRPSKKTKIENDSFLSVPTQDVLDSCVEGFIRRTNNESMKKAVCAVCARCLFRSEMCTKAQKELDVDELLVPCEPHPSHELHGGMLLCPQGIDRAGAITVCADCERHLKNGARPPLSLANNMWVGEVPLALRVLSLPERILIAKYIPTAYIVTMAPKANTARFLDVQSMNVGLRGNVSTYRLNTKAIQELVDDNIMPRPLEVLASTIGVTFVGPHRLPERMLPDMFLVRRSRVARALQWLRENNLVYADIELSSERLHQLPECGVPDEILDAARYSDDTTSYQQEHAGYVPEDDPVESIAERTGWVFGAGRETGLENEEIAPQVISLETNGVVDVGGDSVPNSELAAHAFSNTADERHHLQKFNISRGSAFVNEYARVDENGRRFDGGPENANHLLGSFPVLFPYGRGGFEVARPREVTYEAHIRWAMQYHDGRFRKDLHFAFQVFNIMQKRQVCRSATLQISQAAFKRHERQIMSLKPGDLMQASKEETQGKPFSNEAVRALRQQLTAVRTRVVGTDESRLSLRGKIWGTTIMHCPPSLWITLNPSDTQNPIAQVLAGVDIDLDKFDAESGLEVAQRSITVSKDPYAAAEFFHILITVILEEVMGISSGKGRVQRKQGIFGKVQSYVASVESQGRGTLHLHMIVWLENALCGKDMRERLLSSEFRRKIVKFIETHIHADLSEANDAAVLAMKRKNQVSYCRPLDPKDPQFATKWPEREKELARAVQYHTCSLTACQRVVKNKLVCKRRAPFDLSPKAWISPDGNWGPKRFCGFLNNWNPFIMNTMASNHDIKLLSNGTETQVLSAYVKKYAAKSQSRSFNVSALLARRLMNATSEKGRAAGTVMRNSTLLQTCANGLLREQELSGPMVMSLLMGWGDRYESHHYVTIYWSSAVSALLRAYPELVASASRLSSRQDSAVAAAGETEQETSVIVVQEGKVTLRNQLFEYQIRGEALKDNSFLDFMLNTYDGPKPTAQQLESASLRSQRVEYLKGRGKDTRCRIVRMEDHATLPHFIGRWFPRNDQEESKEFYSASMLMLLKPWREVETDLKRDGESFETAWEAFTKATSERNRRIVDNIQHYHECTTKARAAMLAATEDDRLLYGGEFEDEEEEGDIAVEAGVFQKVITEGDLDIQREKQMSVDEVNFARAAMAIAMDCGVFKDHFAPVPPPDARIASQNELHNISAWQRQLKALTREDGLQVVMGAEETLGGIEAAGTRESMPMVTDVNAGDVNVNERPRPTWALLNADQRRAHDIIEKHLTSHLRGERPQQLLMLVVGAGGTGKSLLIKAITETFEYHEARNLLAKTASSGVAASLIGGQTLHSWAGIPIATTGGIDITKASPKVKEKREHNIGKTDYLVHDEAWMNGKSILGLFGEITAQVKAHGGKGGDGAPFGGMNMIMFGDPHQFPPVRDPNGALYCDRPDKDNARALLGRQLYLQFTKVVILKEQKRIQDSKWQEILDHLRNGECDEGDVKEIEMLEMRPERKPPNFATAPWNNAVLVTSRHAVRNLWNDAALRQHCATTGHRLYRVRSEDTEKETGKVLSLAQKHVVAGMKSKNTGKLTEFIEIAVGMKVMVVLNIATEADVANGTRGVITEIVLDPREKTMDADNTGMVKLEYPPVLIHFKPFLETRERFPGLPEGIIPISPTEVTFTVEVAGKKQSIRRRQLALTGGYAFTDYRAQGQTLEYVVIDLGRPPHGALTPFSVYVALSRSRGRENIRLLRIGDVGLFTKAPSQDLLLEDQRLRYHDERTVV